MVNICDSIFYFFPFCVGLAVIPAVKDIKQSISTIPEDVEEEDEEDFDDKLRSDDVVNCICQINEENGLMIQVRIS